MSPSQFALPPELWDAILDHLHHDRAALRAAALVCRIWVPTTRFYLFEDITLSPKCPARAACLNALLMSPYATIAPAVRKLAVPGALTPVELRCAGGVRHLTTLVGLIPGLGQLPRLKELELSDYPLRFLDGLKTVERITLTGVCAGAGLLRIVHALPQLAQLTLDGVAAVLYHSGGHAIVESTVRRVTIRGSSLAFLGWLALAAPHVAALSVDTLVSSELQFLAEYLAVLGATLQELELSFFDVDPLDALALPTLLAPCSTLKTLRLHFISASDVRHFFTFDYQGPWPPAMRLEVVIADPINFESSSSQFGSLDELFRHWTIDVRVVHAS